MQDGIFSSGVHSHYVLSGEFLIHIFRMKDEKVRVKIIALRKKGMGASTSLDIGFKIFGIGIVDNKIKRVLDMNLARLGWNQEKGNLFLMDFVYDLRDENAARAYNQILSSTYKFKNMRVLNPFLNHRDLEDQLISDLTLTNEIFEEDQKSSPDKRRVDRVFKGSNEFEKESSGFKFGFNLAKWSKDSTYTDNQISFVDRNNQKHHFYFPHHTVTSDQKLLFGFSKTSTTRNYFALWPTDENGESADLSRHTKVSTDPLDGSEVRIEKLPSANQKGPNVADFKDFGMNYEWTDKRMWGFQHEEFKKFIQRNVRSEIFDQIKWGDWAEDKLRHNVRFFFQAIIHKVGIGEMVQADKSNLHSRLQNFMLRVPLPPVQNRNSNDVSQTQQTWQDENAHSLRVMTEGLEEALSGELEMKDRERIKKLMDLRSNTAFEELGTGFLMDLLDRSKLGEQISLTLHMSAKDTKPLHFEYGNHQLEELYKELQYVQGVLGNRSHDMRILNQQVANEQGNPKPGNSDYGTGEEISPEEFIEKRSNEESEKPDISNLQN